MWSLTLMVVLAHQEPDPTSAQLFGSKFYSTLSMKHWGKHLLKAPSPVPHSPLSGLVHSRYNHSAVSNSSRGSVRSSSLGVSVYVCGRSLHLICCRRVSNLDGSFPDQWLSKQAIGSTKDVIILDNLTKNHSVLVVLGSLLYTFRSIQKRGINFNPYLF